jgi:subtilisin family serine protease
MKRSSVRLWSAAFAILLAAVAPPPTSAVTGSAHASPFGIQIRAFEPHRSPALPPYDPSSVIVGYRADAAKSASARAEVRRIAAATLSRAYRTLPDVESLELHDGVTVEAAIAALAADPRVAFAEPNYTVEPHVVPDDPGFDAEWGLHNVGQPVADSPSAGEDIDIDAPEAWDLATGSSSVVVGIVDEGLDVTHPDLEANVWTNDGEIPENGLDDDGNGFVDDIHGWDFFHDDATVFDGANDSSNGLDFHGTHTGGTVGAVGNNGRGVTGVCWNVQLMSLKFLQNGGYTDDAIAAIDYATAMKQRGVNLRAINASWGGGGYSQGLQDAIAAAGNAGILFCASSGNGGEDGQGDDIDRFPVYPAAYDLPTIITVGAWTRYDHDASFSNYGAASVDLIAPGSTVASTGPNGSYYYSSGTSMAAPHVTGTVALLASIAPSLSPAQIKQIILDTAVEVGFAHPTATNGRLNLQGAVEAAVAASGNPPPGPGDPGDPGEPPGPPPPPPVPSPVVSSVTFDKKRKTLFVEGREMRETSVVEVDGVALRKMVFAVRDRLLNGTYVRMGAKNPKIQKLLPKGETVTVTVYDSSTGLRSAPIQYRR